MGVRSCSTLTEGSSISTWRDPLQKSCAACPQCLATWEADPPGDDGRKGMLLLHVLQDIEDAHAHAILAGLVLVALHLHRRLHSSARM